MLKLLSILLIGLVFESTGIVYLKKGMNQIGEVKVAGVGEAIHLFKVGITNYQIILGVFFQALFFACLLFLMSKSDISFLWPLTSLTFVFSTLAAMWFLGETVSSVRWVGIVFILIGAAFISYSEHIKKRDAPPPATAAGRVSPE